MPQQHDEGQDRIGVPDPADEPKPPRLEDAGRLGQVGERKLDDTGKREKEAIWRDRQNERGPGSNPVGSKDEQEI